MNGGNLSDQQLKEFDAYLNGDAGDKPSNPKLAESKPIMNGAKPQSSKTSTGGDLDKIIALHKEKVDMILDLLDKIDAKAHKEIVADLVDEMQYQKSIVKREENQLGNLKKLIALADEATK